MMLPVRFSIAGKGRVKWPSYGKSKGESIRSCDHLRGETHTEQEDESTGLASVKDHSAS